MRPLIFHWTLVVVVAFLAGLPAASCQDDDWREFSRRERTFKYARARYDEDSLLIAGVYMKQYPFLERLKQGQPSSGSSPISFYENTDVNLEELTEDDMILEIIHKVYASRTTNFNFGYDNPEDKARAVDPKLVSEARCSRDLAYLSQQLARKARTPVRGLTPEVAALFDSYAGQESNLFLGHINWLGDFRECTKRHIIDIFAYNNSEPEQLISVKGRYCIASIRGPNWDDKIEARVEQLNKKDYFKREYQDLEYRNFMAINLGVCLPESCESRSIDNSEHFATISNLVKHKLNEPFKSYKMIRLFCLPDEGSELRKPETSGKIYMSFVAIWLTVVFLATLFDYFKLIDFDSPQMSERKLQDWTVFERLVSSFSTIRCFSSLKKSARFTGNTLGLLEGHDYSESNPAKLFANDLYFLHLFKVGLLFCVLLGHIGMISLWLGLTPLSENQSNFVNCLFMAFTLNVDWYFVITGFTVTYLMMGQESMRVLSFAKWLYLLFHRYCRLAPVYLMLFWSARTVGHLIGSGPLWDYRTSNSSHVNMCRKESLVIAHTLSPNFHSMYNECIGPAWYIGNDFQFAMITPLLLYLFHRNFRLTYVASVATILISCTMLALRITQDPDLQPFKLIYPRGEILMHVIWDFDSIYLYPWYRVGPFLLGALAGHFCFMVRTGRWRSTFLAQTQTGSGGLAGTWKRSALAALGLGLCFYTNLAPYLGELQAASIRSLDEARTKAALAFLFHTITAVGPTLLITAVALGHWPRFRRLAENSLFGYLSSLNYFVYLAQIEVMSWFIGTAYRPPERSMKDNGLLFPALLIYLYLLSAPVTLFLSQPVCRLERAFVGVYATSSKSKPNSNSKPEFEPVGAGGRQREAKQLVEMNGQ